MKVLFLCTGGTIDKDYSSNAGTYNFEIAEPAIGRILKRINTNLEYDIISILKKDSLDMDDHDREKIYRACSEANNNKVIITHGTDTMTETAKKLSSIKDKAIVLVGSSKPEKFNESDAEFNIGTAIGAINILNSGVYIAINGCVYKWNEVRKKEDGYFEKI